MTERGIGPNRFTTRQGLGGRQLPFHKPLGGLAAGPRGGRGAGRAAAAPLWPPRPGAAAFRPRPLPRPRRRRAEGPFTALACEHYSANFGRFVIGRIEADQIICRRFMADFRSG